MPTVTHHAVDFASVIFEPEDLIEIRMLPSGKREWVKASELANLTEALTSHNLDGQNIYFGANPRVRERCRKIQQPVRGFRQRVT